MFTLHSYACMNSLQMRAFMAELYALFYFCLQCLISLCIEIYSFNNVFYNTYFWL